MKKLRKYFISTEERNYSISKLLILFGILFFTTNACQKDELTYDTPNEHPVLSFSKTAAETSLDFFDPYFAANNNPNVNPYIAVDDQTVDNPLLQEILQELSTENDANEFVTKITNLIGYPVWNKSIIYDDFPNTSEVSLTLTPFTLLDDNMVSAVLASVKTDGTFYYKVYNWEVDYFLTLDSDVTQLNFDSDYVTYVNNRKKLYDAFDAIVFNPLYNGYEIANTITAEDLTMTGSFINNPNGGYLFTMGEMEDMDEGEGSGGTPCSEPDDCPDWNKRPKKPKFPNTGGGNNGGSNSGGNNTSSDWISIVFSNYTYYGGPGWISGGGFSDESGDGSHFEEPGNPNSGMDLEEFYEWEDFGEYINETISEMEISLALDEMGGFFASVETDCAPLSENAFDIALYILLDALQGELPDVDVPSIEELGDISMAQTAFETGNFIPTATLVLEALDNDISSEDLSRIIAGLGNVTREVVNFIDELDDLCESSGEAGFVFVGENTDNTQLGTAILPYSCETFDFVSLPTGQMTAMVIEVPLYFYEHPSLLLPPRIYYYTLSFDIYLEDVEASCEIQNLAAEALNEVIRDLLQWLGENRAYRYYSQDDVNNDFESQFGDLLLTKLVGYVSGSVSVYSPPLTSGLSPKFPERFTPLLFSTISEYQPGDPAEPNCCD